VDKLLKSTTNIRDRTIMEVLYSTGLRASELCSLKWTDIDTDQGTIRVRDGKGGKDRIVVFNGTVTKQLAVYEESLNGQHVDRVFPIHRKTVWMIVKRCAKATGLSWVTPHTLRHTFATHLLNGGANTRDIQELLGHARLETTQIYTHVASARMRKVHREFHPRG
jgi:integrase/recombinase XerD